MEYDFLLAVITLVFVDLLVTPVIGSISCTQACNAQRDSIVCKPSVILITDVTNLNMEKNHLAFENVRRDCMGKESCDPSRTCGTEFQQTTLVHYLCVNASNILSNSCSRRGIKINGSSGYIQSEGYPAPTRFSCKWEIDVPTDSALVLSLHEFVIKDRKDTCDQFLVVSGHPCDGKTHLTQFCGKDNTTSIMRCGKFDIHLQENGHYELRFWLSYQVWQRDQLPSSQSPVHCQGPGVRSNHGWTGGGMTTEISGVGNQDTNTEVLVIMLSIISGISAVLLIILVIVCVRCRLLQASHAEFTYSDPSPSIPAHYMYVSSSETEKSRPQLAEGYFEVADALPFTQREEISSTPAYAEIGQYSRPREILRSLSEGAHSEGTRFVSKKKQRDNEFKNAEDKQTDNSSVKSPSKHTLSDRLKDEVCKQGHLAGHYINNKSSSGSKSTTPNTQPNNDDDGFSNYETIEKCSQNNLFSNCNQKPHLQVNQPDSRKLSDDNMPQGPKTINSLANKTQKSDCHSKIISSSLSVKSNTLPNKSSKGILQTREVKNNDGKHCTYKDMPRGSGIVKNGIKKFEQHST